MKKIFIYCFDKWWRPIIFTVFSMSFVLIYPYVQMGSLTYSQCIEIFRVLIGSSLIGLFISGIYQLIKKRWKESVLIILIFIGFSAVNFYPYFMPPPDYINPKIIELYPSGKIKKKNVYPFAGDSLYYHEDTFYESGVLKSHFECYNGKLSGLYDEYFENGKIKFSAHTNGESFYGYKYCYYENGSIYQQDSLIGYCKMSNCDCDGNLKRYYQNGNLKEKFPIRNGTINGDAFDYYENGKIKRKCFVVNDKIEGFQKEWYEDGKLKSEIMYSNGVPDGKTIEYLPKYNIHGQFENGKEEGDWMYIDSLGNIKRVDVYKNGVIIKYGKKIN